MPASASLIVVMSPARPPPTTATRGAISGFAAQHHGAVLETVRLLEEVHAQPAEPEQRSDAQERQRDEDRESDAGDPALAGAARREAPVDREAEEPVAEVIAGRHGAEQVDASTAGSRGGG